MKKVLGTLVSIFMLLAILGGFKLTAHANSVYDFGIAQADDKTVVINAYYGDSAEVKIPSKIHGFTVVGIVEDAFYGREDIKKVTLPNTIKDIKAGVFKNTALYKNPKNWKNGSLYISNSLIAVKPSEVKDRYQVKEGTTCIADSAFANCTNLKEITIPKSVKGISSKAFYGCTNLSKVNIFQNLKYVGEKVFEKTAYYKNSKNWKNNALYLNDCLVQVNSKKIKGSYKVKSGTTYLAESVFKNCKSLTSVTIPDSVTKIEAGGFEGCSKLKSATLSKKMTKIEAGTFFKCKSLKDIKLSKNITYIGDMAFACCESLEEIKLPKNITDLSAMTFMYCKSSKSITIPEGLTYLNTVVFSDCKNLTKVVIPKSMTSIAEDAFDNCSKLTDITYKGTKAQWKKIEIWGNMHPSEVIHQAAIHCTDGIVKPTILRTTKIQSVKVNKTSVQLTWKKTDYIKGYQIQISTDNKFKKNVRTIKIKKSMTTKTTINNLKSGKKYYVRIRTYEGKYHSSWSKISSITTK